MPRTGSTVAFKFHWSSISVLFHVKIPQLLEIVKHWNVFQPQKVDIAYANLTLKISQKDCHIPNIENNSVYLQTHDQFVSVNVYFSPNFHRMHCVRHIHGPDPYQTQAQRCNLFPPPLASIPLHDWWERLGVKRLKQREKIHWWIFKRCKRHAHIWVKTIVGASD